MSLSTLAFHDKCRSGCSVAFMQADLSPDGVFQHPFMWNDHYWRPASLTPETEVRTVAAAEALVELLNARETRLNEVPEASLQYYRLLTQCVAEVLSDPTVDFIDVLMMQLATERMRCLYNVATAWLISGLRQRNRVGAAALRLTEAAGLFDLVLNCDFRVESNRNELSPDNLRALAAICMGCAAETSFQYHFKDSFLLLKENAQLAHKASFYFTIAAAIATNSMCVVEQEAVLNFCHIKRDFYEGMCLYLLSSEIDTTKGESRRRKASSNFESAMQHTLRMLPGDRRSVEAEIRLCIDKCANFRRLIRKSRIPEAVFLQQRRRYEGHLANFPPAATLEPSFPPQLAFLHPSKDESASGAGPVTVATNAPAPIDALLLVDVAVDERDLRLETPTFAPSDVSTRYHKVSALVSLKGSGGESEAAEVTTSRAAFVLVVDINNPNAALAKQLRDMIAFSIRAGRLDAEDMLALATFGDDGVAKGVSLVSASEANINSIADAITRIRGRGKHQGSKGTCLASAVFAAREALATLDVARFPCREVVVISDGWDSMFVSDRASWDLMCARSSELDAAIPVHTFAATTSADAELLRGLSRRTEGNHGAQFLFDDSGIATVRNWLVTIVASMKRRIASNLRLTVTCAKDVLLGSILHSHHEEPLGDNAPAAGLRGEVSVRLAPVAVEQRSHAVLTFLVPTELGRHDVVRLGTVTVDFDSAMSALPSHTVRHFEVLNACAKGVVDRENFAWLEQLLVEELRGVAAVKTPMGGLSVARGGEAVVPNDSVFTEVESTVSLVSVEGARIELDPSTDVQFEAVNKKGITLRLAGGGVSVRAAASLDVTVKCGPYTVVVTAGSAVRVSFTDEMLNANCILGKAVITTERQSETLRLHAPKQTSARAPAAPAMPWAITEDVFDAWVCAKGETASRLRTVIDIHTQQCRLVMARAASLAARYLARAKRVATLSQTKAAQRCRTFLINHMLQGARTFVANSLAYSTTNESLDGMRHEFEVAVRIGMPRNRFTLTWTDVETVHEVARSLQAERPIGGCAAFRTKDHRQQVEALLNAREKQALAADMARLAALRETKDAEQRRRRDVLAALFTSCDLCARNAVESRHIHTVLQSLPVHLSIVQICLERWTHVIDVLLSSAATRDAPQAFNLTFSPEQFVATLSYITEPLQPFEFNNVTHLIAVVAAKTGDIMESGRVERSLSSLFPAFDPKCVGAVRFGDLISDVRTVIGDDLAVFRRIQSLTAEAIAVANELLREPLPKVAAHSEATTPDKKKVDQVGDRPLGIDTRPDTPTSSSTGAATPDNTKQTEATNASPTGGAAGESESEAVPIIDFGCESPKQETAAQSSDQGAAQEPNIQLTSESSAGGSQTAPAEAPMVVVVAATDAAPAAQQLSETAPLPVEPEIPAPTIGTVEDVKLTLYVFVRCMAAFFAAVDESTAQTEILRLFQRRGITNRRPHDMEYLMRRERKDKEKDHLLTWDARHVFDGVTRKHLQHVVSPAFKEPSFIQEFAAPICILAGLSKEQGGSRLFHDDGSVVVRKAEDHWGTLRRALRRDPQGLISFLEAFPVLSISHKQAQRVAQFLHEPHFDPAILLKTSVVLSSLCAWVHTMLRVAFLEFEFEVPPKVCDRLLSVATATQFHVEQLTKIAPLPPTVAPPTTSNIQRLQNGFCHHFSTVFRPPPIIGQSEHSRFAPLTPAAPLVTSNGKAPRVQSAPAQRAAMPTLTLAVTATALVAKTSAPSSEAAAVSEAATSAAVLAATPPRLPSSLARPQSAYVKAAARNLSFRPRSTASAASAGGRPSATEVTATSPPSSPPPQLREAFAESPAPL